MTIWKYKLEFCRWHIHVSKRPEGDWTPIDSPEARRALMEDDQIGL